MDPQTYQETGDLISLLLTIAWLLPLGGFAVEIFAGFWGSRLSKTAAYLAVACIGAGFLCSLTALCVWHSRTDGIAFADHHSAGHHDAGHHDGGEDAGHDEHAHDDKDGHAKEGHGTESHSHGADSESHGHEHEHADEKLVDHELVTKTSFSGTYYTLAHFGSLKLSIDYYIDSLTLVMFTMVTLIASCIHIFAIGYMSDELTENYVDHQVHTSHGHFHRPGRFYRFFAFLSLFSFSMLGLVIAGNIFLVFIFWELVGISSYFLIGFYVERKSASTAANKAFIMNRVGDFGFLIGLMIIWTYFGTFQFADTDVDGHVTPGLFTMVRGSDGDLLVNEVDGEQVVVLRDQSSEVIASSDGLPRTVPYYLLVAAGIGIFAGCVGKSAQFPLQTWLPDAMEGPTPVSALVHSATMVAAGVYLAGRFYPMFLPEVLLTIAYIGAITLFLAATIAVVATDIKRVLAYSTISQLGYMMLAIGVGGWGAGLFHLITHAFFKSLMFLCSGSVIHGCHHVQEMPQMGGLRRKMPFTAYTMLIGVIAISGLAIPGTAIAFSGYHSKDAIVATALTFTQLSGHALLFFLPLVGAGITAFYMFRLWLYTFTGKPRDQHVYDHAHESPLVMVAPLILLSFFAAFCAYGGEEGPLFKLLVHSEPVGVADGFENVGLIGTSLPSHGQVHDNHAHAGMLALVAAIMGTLGAYLFYGIRIVDPAAVQQQFSGLHAFLVNKWGFDDLYDAMFTRPVHQVASWATWFDRTILDGFLHGTCRLAIDVSRWDRIFDETIVDGLVNVVGRATRTTGYALRTVQTGQLRNYVLFIALGVLGLFVLLIAWFPV